MSYTSGPVAVAPAMVSTFTPGWAFAERPRATAPASGSIEALNRCIFIPIVVPCVTTIRRVWWANGSSVAGNSDVGVYRDAGGLPGALIVSSGSTANSGTSALQFVTVTTTVLSPGPYWLALAASDGAKMRSTVGAEIDAVLRMQQSSTFPLPAAATPVESTSTNYYVFGFATTASP